MRYAALIPCGPAEPEVERVCDLLDALRMLDPEDCVVALILNDGNARLRELVGMPLARIEDNPRHGEGWGWAGGLIAAELWALELLLREYPEAECMVKFDTDALPIKPLGPPLETVLADPLAGFAGERTGYDPFSAEADKSPRAARQRMVRKLRAPMSLWRKPHWHVRISLAGRHRWIAQLYAKAERNGYVPGDVVEGGACAFSRECAWRLSEAGVLQRWRDFIDIATGDDVVLTMLPYVVGLRAVSATLFSPGDQMALKFAPERLLRHPEVGAVHSVKRYEQLGEAEIRALLKKDRQERTRLVATGE